MPDRDMLELDFGTAILTSYDGAHLTAQFDSEGDDATTGDGTGGAQTASAEVHSPFGLDGRPRDPSTNSDGTPGIGATAMRAIEGRTQHMHLFGDPRCTAALPTLEKGSARLYAHLSGDKVTWLRLDGSTGSAKLRVPVGAGESTVEVDGATGDVTITHQAGTKAVVKSDAVYLGSDVGATALTLSTPLMTWITSVLIPALAASPGGPITVAPPAGIATTKVNGV